MQNGYILDNSCFNILPNYFTLQSKAPDFANGRLARKLVESCIKAQSARLSMNNSLTELTDKDLDTIIAADCEKAIQLI